MIFRKSKALSSNKEDISDYNDANSLIRKKNRLEAQSQTRIGTLLLMLVITLIGVACLYYSSYFPSTDFNYLALNSIAASLMTTGILSFLYEAALRKNFLKTNKLIYEEVLDETLPSSLKNMRDNGLIDVYENFNITKFASDIIKLENQEIRILNIYISGIEHLTSALKNAVHIKNCTVKIILLDPTAEATILARSKSLDNLVTPEQFVEKINTNIHIFREIYKELKALNSNNLNEKLQVRVHNSFVVAPLFGYANSFIVGHYLAKQYSTASSMIKVGGTTKPLFKQFSKHFEIEWGNATPIDLDMP